MPNPVTPSDLARAIRAAGLSKSVVALHASLKSFGRLEGGPASLLQAFIEAGCTVLAPTFTYACQMPPQRDVLQNGLEPGYTVDIRHSIEFDQTASFVSPDMGSIPACLLQTAGRVRGHHPLNSFAALGPLAESVIAEQDLLNVYGPYKWLYDYPRAYLLLVGVDLTRATPIHFAEEQAGRRLFRRWGLEAGAIVESETGGCSEGFNNLEPSLRSIEQRLHVGPSLWRIYPFREFVDRVSHAIAANPAITHCDNPHCARCNDALRGGPLIETLTKG